MVKGFKDSKGKFRPTGNKGVSSREKTIESSGTLMTNIRDEEIEDKSLEIVGDIEENFDRILARTAMNKNCKIEKGKLIRLGGSSDELLPEGTQVEEICGAVTDQIERFINDKYGKEVACEEVGMYTGEGAENSAGFVPSLGGGEGNEVRHEWIRLADGTIIDGAGGQFVSDKETISNEDRLRIISPDDPRQNWYNPNEKMCDLCGGRLVGGKCPSPDVDAIMKLVDTGLTVDEAREKIAEGS